jgi:hypothetical protein
MRQSHVVVCAVLVVAGVALVAAGLGAATLIPAIACMAMMAGMMWMMAGGRGGGSQ